MTDSEVTAALWKAAFEEKVGSIHARRIIRRKHFKCLYRRNPEDVSTNPESGELVFKALAAQYGEEHFRHDRYRQKSGAPDFPVRMRDGRIVSSIAFSEVLSNMPVVSVDYVFANRQFFDEANTWLNDNRSRKRRNKMDRMKKAGLLTRLIEEATEAGATHVQSHVFCAGAH